MGSNKELTANNPEADKDEKNGSGYDGEGAVIPAEQEKMDQENGAQIKEPSEDNEAMITCELMDTVNDCLKKPIVVVPEFWGLDIRKIGVMGDNALLKEISTA